MLLTQFIRNDSYNKRFLLIALVGTLLQFVLFKLLYPYPDFFSDSYSYLYAAYANLDVSIWPIGYSKFLRWFHLITPSDTALVSFQYLLYIFSALYLFFSLLYFYHPTNKNKIILFVFLFFNPLFLYLCNYVNSDPLFLALSLCWFTELLWIINQPRTYQIFLQALLLFACFTVRNNAYYYPLIAGLAFFLSKQKLSKKIIGTTLGFALIIPFVIHTRDTAYKLTGTRQFSLFSGWQLANNALYMYEYADTIKSLSPQCQELDRLSKGFYSNVDSDFHKYLSSYVGNLFIREPYSPLKSYLRHNYKMIDDYSTVVAWGKASVIFSEYGSYIIKHNPLAYLHEFILPNAKIYFLPPLEKLEIYNLGNDKVEPIAKSWFHYSSEKVASVSSNIQGEILFLYPIIFLIINFYMLITLFLYWWRDKYKKANTEINRFILLNASIWLANFVFCVSATIIVFRYEIFPLIIFLISSIFAIQWLSQDRSFKSINVITPEGNTKYSIEK